MRKSPVSYFHSSFIRILIGVAALVLIAGSFAEGALETNRVRVGMPVSSLAFLPLYAAEAEGLFDAAGLDVTLFTFRGGSDSVRAAVGGQVDIAAGSISELLSALTADQPLKMFWGFNQAPIYELWALPGTPELPETAGLRFAISSFGALSNQAVDYMVSQAGVSPDSIVLVPSGGPAARLAALQTSQVDVALLSQPTSLIAEREGYKLLGVMSDYAPNWQNQIFYARTDFLESENTINAFLNVVVEAIDLIESDEEVRTRLTMEYVGFSREDAELGYASYAGTWPRTGQPAREGIDILARFHAESEGLDEPFALSDFMD